MFILELRVFSLRELRDYANYVFYKRRVRRGFKLFYHVLLSPFEFLALFIEFAGLSLLSHQVLWNSWKASQMMYSILVTPSRINTAQPCHNLQWCRPMSHLHFYVTLYPSRTSPDINWPSLPSWVSLDWPSLRHHNWHFNKNSCPQATNIIF